MGGFNGTPKEGADLVAECEMPAWGDPPAPDAP